MAHVNDIWFHSRNWMKSEMDVEVALKPAGNVRLKVRIPTDFREAILKLAQTAADAHEAQMRAEILGDQATSIEGVQP